MQINEIFNRSPSIAEDALYYELYPPSDACGKAPVTALALALQAFVDEALKGFIWHRDSFELKLREDEDKNAWHIVGYMRVGDSVDDEWCAVWLLREISARWDVAASVYDADGDFLLIEAADVLPTWVTPSNSENRVWIYKSQLQLIPLKHFSPSSTRRRRRRALADDADGDELDSGNVVNPEKADDWLSVQDALRLVRDPVEDTKAPPAVDEIVWERIKRYPAALSLHIHKTKAFLPIDIVKALAVQPSLVQKAVEVFYTRDPIQLRAAHKMSRFPPSQSVLRLVTMTRTAYAQLMGQKFYPPKIFGTWAEHEGGCVWRWKDIGMKIACGFEMLYQEGKNRVDAMKSADGLRASADARKDTLRRDPEYAAYIRTLMSAGYFKDEVEGSQLWKELEDKAVEVYMHTRQDEASLTRPSFAAQVNEAVVKSDRELSDQANELEDPDDWLNVNAADFDSLLAQKMGLGQGNENKGAEKSGTAMDVDGPSEDEEEAGDMIAKEQAARLQDLAKRVEKFLGGKGDIEGAKFEDERSDDDSDEEGEPSEFSDERFSDSEDEESEKMDDAARQAAMDKLVPGLEPSEYGRMPSQFYANSQRTAPARLDSSTVGGALSANSSLDFGDTKLTSTPQKPLRGPIIMRDRYDGVDSDDETDEEDPEQNSEDEEDQPQVVGEVEVDMCEEEDEFLEFSRQALGISDEQWANIIQERKARGAFVPSHVTTESQPKKQSSGTMQTISQSDEPKFRRPVPGPRPNANPDLDSFEAVMQAMEEELARARAEKRPFQPKTEGKGAADVEGKGKAKDEGVPEEEDVDIEAAMEAELRETLEGGEDEDEDGFPLGTDSGVDYNLIKNFLESFKSQGGLAGPVSNLAGRLQPGWNLPRDEA
ncbi:SGT1 protein-domain-containing protein [Vararia minispora EC-137]|uniref:SGT1 protein-domain-containing protein n=1 Tax=Vararia minispora EC-137 TaxID=1314806 RepID=A0ACB8QBZ9_9AGAM|nr:SGT1 protein-domain-containing protein [Vararia minispora EC-137]